VQRYYKYLNCANFLAIIFQKKLQSFPKQKCFSHIINDLQFLSTEKVVQNINLLITMGSTALKKAAT